MRADQGQRRLHLRGKIGRHAMTVHVHVVDARRVEEEVVVQRGDIKPVGQQRGHHRIDLVFREHEIAHHHVHPARAFRQSQPSAKAERRGRGDAVDDDVQIIARDVHLQDVVLEIALLAKRREHGLVVGRHRGLGEYRGREKKKQEGEQSAHSDLREQAKI